MKHSGLGLLGAIGALGLTLWTAPARAAATARPGTLNYVEGRADIADANGGRTALNAKSIGSEEVNPGETLETGQGKAEVLLTPGVFFRLGEDSAMRIVSPGLTNTRVELLKGRALVEAANLLPENNIQVMDDGATTRLLKPGLYAFNANQVAVYDGKAEVQQDDRNIELKSWRRLDLQTPAKPVKFDKKDAANQDPLYQWSSARSEYLAQANAASVQNYYVAPGYWGGVGWFWNPYFSMYTYMPGDFLYSPFGWGYYPFYWGGPIIGYRGGGGFWHGGYHHPAPGRMVPHHRAAPAPRMSAPAPRMSAPRSFGGGGFHGVRR